MLKDDIKALRSLQEICKPHYTGPAFDNVIAAAEKQIKTEPKPIMNRIAETIQGRVITITDGWLCPDCNNKIPVTSVFCGNCGKKISDSMEGWGEK